MATFNNEAYSTYDYGYSVLFINPHMKLDQMRVGAPLFFKNSKRGEINNAYRGHVLSKIQAPFVTVNAFDNRKKRMVFIGRAEDMDEAKELVDEKLSKPATLKLSVRIERIDVPVVARIHSFEDAGGNVVATDLFHFDEIGNSDELGADEALSEYVANYMAKRFGLPEN